MLSALEDKKYESIPDLNDVYTTIEKSRKHYGRLYKFEIHMHTPASHDYEIEQTNTPNDNRIFYKERTMEWIFEYAKNIGMIDETSQQDYLKNYQEGVYGVEYMQKLREKGLEFDDFKEYFTYYMIAFKLYKEQIEGVIIADHNTIEGYHKLKSILKHCYINEFKHLKKRDIWVILGVEITCSDKNHVLAMFDDKMLGEVNKFLDENIIREEGTIEHSLSIIEKVNEIGGKAYIAHINSSNFKQVTKVYKENLFGSPLFNLVGLTNLKKNVHSIIRNFTSKNPEDICVFYESDAHGINNIGKKNTWIKLDKVNFATLKKAILNHSVSVYREEKPKLNSKFIKGLFIPSGHKGFLRGKDNESEFHFDLSKDLNCIIGGRGTGKSTVLHIIDTILSQEAANKEILKFISLHEKVYLVFRIGEQDYIIRFLAQINKNVPVDDPNFFLDRAFNRSRLNYFEEGSIKLSNDWCTLYRVVSEKIEEDLLFEKIDNLSKKESIFNAMYKNHYSINKIISKIDGGNVGTFIKEIMFSGEMQENFKDALNELSYMKKSDFMKNIIPLIHNIEATTETWKTSLQPTIDLYNDRQKNIIEIKLTKNSSVEENYLDYLFELIEEKKRKPYAEKNYVAQSTLEWSDIADYSNSQISQMGLLKFLVALFNKDYRLLESNYKLVDFARENYNSSLIDKGYLNPEDRTTRTKIFNEVRDAFATYRSELVVAIDRATRNDSNFEMYFNVNAKETVEDNTVYMKNVKFLSLGQKVVAILTFIMSYGKYSNDTTPLIIDQPEDNLDNQYIYKTLVKSLKEIKNERQVVIVTHNSTLVTNADAEQVVVLESNGTNSILKKQGYISDKIIMSHIINYLEGGKDAFKRKTRDYQAILESEFY